MYSFWCILAFAVTTIWANNISQPIAIFRSRPDLVTPVLTVLQHNASLQAPGYYFIAPYQQVEPGIMIYDNDANLVYSGWANIGGGISHSPQTCQYKGETHLCFYQGSQMKGWAHGHGVILDKHYHIVKTVHAANYQGASDMHEFKVLENGKTAIMSQYVRHVYDLCDWGICRGLGYIQEGCFQEVDIETGELLFEWRSLDHIDPSESWVGPSSTEISGSGEQPDSPWDYIHINSVDKNADGDYLISARHTSALYKISGKDGHVIWRLNGAKSDFHLKGFVFSSQHDARFISDDEHATVLSIFDNGNNGFNHSAPHSTAKIIKINHETKIAILTHELHPPAKEGGKHTSRSQGSYQRLAGGNELVGWGSEAFWTEYTPSGEVAFYGNIGYTSVMNYRVHKFDDWVGLPLTKPALWTYSKLGGKRDGMWFYMSWNGATEVRQWRIYSSDTKTGDFTLLATRDKSGFETIYRDDHAFKYAYVEALGSDQHVLGESQIQEIFVPNARMLSYCDELACKNMPRLGEPEYAELVAERKQRKLAEQQRLKEEEERKKLGAEQPERQDADETTNPADDVRTKEEEAERQTEADRLRVEAQAEAERLAKAEAEAERAMLAEEAKMRQQEKTRRQGVVFAAVMAVALAILAGVGLCAGLKGSAGRRLYGNTGLRATVMMRRRWRVDSPPWSPTYSKLKTEEDG